MAKTKVLYQCSNCGEQTTKWQGQCTACHMWNTLIEASVQESELFAGRLEHRGEKALSGTVRVTKTLEEVFATSDQKENQRYFTNLGELDRVFGGGIAHASVTLLSGEPGIGKSTISVQLAGILSNAHQVLYVSAEESLAQVAGRAKRLGVKGNGLTFLHESVVEHILATVIEQKPDIVILDSISVLFSGSIGSMAGSIGQVRFVTELVVEAAKKYGFTVIIIGHVTKDGSIAGPKVLEHLVDTVLVLEGEKSNDLRFLKALKNRFGPTDEVGVFQMAATGLQEVKNPSERFLSGRAKHAFGTVITSAREGTRSFLLEVQALTSYTKFGYPKRTALGISLQRLQLLLAVLGSYSNLNPDQYDVYTNLVGGLRVHDTALDLATLMAVYSAKHKTELPADLLVLGEVGLTGEIRAISYLQDRLKEAVSLGMKSAIVPASQVASLKIKGIELKGVSTVKEALGHITVKSSR